MNFEAYVANSSLSDSDITKAKKALKAYKFPVMSAVFNYNGELLNSLNANDLLEETQKETEKLMAMKTFSNNGFSSIDPMSSIYLRFLNEAISKHNLIY